MLGISASTLSRREDLAGERRGERDVALAPGEVLRLAAVYRKRSLNDVAYDLIEHARGFGDEEAERVEGEIESYFAAQGSGAEQREQLRVLARRLLPAGLCERIESVLDANDHEQFPTDILGWSQPPDD